MRKILTVLVLTLALLLPSGVALGKEFPAMTNVNPKKMWIIKFSQPVDINSVSNSEICVKDSGGKIINTILNLESDLKTIEMLLIENSYKDGDYVLTISKNITSNGKHLDEETILRFQVGNN